MPPLVRNDSPPYLGRSLSAINQQFISDRFTLHVCMYKITKLIEVTSVISPTMCVCLSWPPDGPYQDTRCYYQIIRQTLADTSKMPILKYLVIRTTTGLGGADNDLGRILQRIVAMV